jgi:aspartate carbamoyltransferase catalytic subunit
LALESRGARAEASFRKEESAKDGAMAMTDYQANIRLVREKTERLRALRLAKEAAEQERVGK